MDHSQYRIGQLIKLTNRSAVRKEGRHYDVTVVDMPTPSQKKHGEELCTTDAFRSSTAHPQTFKYDVVHQSSPPPQQSFPFTSINLFLSNTKTYDVTSTRATGVIITISALLAAICCLVSKTTRIVTFVFFTTNFYHIYLCYFDSFQYLSFCCSNLLTKDDSC